MAELEQTTPRPDTRLSREQIATEGGRLKEAFQGSLGRIPAVNTALRNAFFQGSIQSSPAGSQRPELNISCEVGEGEEARIITVTTTDQVMDRTFDRRRDGGLYTHLWNTHFSVSVARPEDPSGDYLCMLGFEEERVWDIQAGSSKLVTGDGAAEIKESRCYEILSRGPLGEEDFGGRVGGFHGIPDTGVKTVAGAEEILNMIKAYESP